MFCNVRINVLVVQHPSDTKRKEKNNWQIELFVFPRKGEKISLSPHKNNASFSLCITIIEERLYLSFTKKKLKKKKKIQRSLLMLDARVKLRQKAQLAELCSRWVGTNIVVPFLLFFFLVLCFSIRVKSQRVLDIHFLWWDARALCAFVLRCNKIRTTLLLHTTLSSSLKQTCDRSWKS